MNAFLFVQNALSPNFLYYSNRLFNVRDLKKSLEDLPSSKLPNKLLVNVGPGSYTGIRVGLAFALAVSQLERAEIYTYDSFELVRFLANTEQRIGSTCIFIQSWPRRLVNLTPSAWENFKGYFKCGDQELFVSIKDISPQETVLYLPLDQEISPFRERLREFKSVLLYKDLLNPKKIVNFVEQRFKNKSSLSSDFAPKYISPVNITKPRNETASSI